MMRLLSLGSGVQSTTVGLMAKEGLLDRLDGAIFPDTGNEPPAVYQHFGVLSRELEAAGIPVYRASVGDIIAGALGLPDDQQHILSRPAGWFASMPLYLLKPDGTRRMLPRQCTGDYKLAAVKAQTRALLTGRGPTARVPRGVYAETWVGFSTDEIGRVRPADVQYQRLRFPLLELGMDRKACRRWLESRGWTAVQRSACIVCPLHGNRIWRDMRDNRPDDWAMAVAFDRQLRIRSAYTHGPGAVEGQVFVHHSFVPLDEALIDWRARDAAALRIGQGTLFDPDAGDPDGCGPWSCRSGAAVPA